MPLKASRSLHTGNRERLACSYSLTETSHGSHIRSLDTKAVRAGDEWILIGEKSFVTSGDKAEFFVMLAETAVGVSAFAAPILCRASKKRKSMIGLLLLKHICGLSYEGLFERWVHDPYFQYFTGEELFQHSFPHERSDLSH